MRIRVVQGWVDPRRRDPAEILEAWPTLARQASALAEAGASVEVVTAAAADAERVDGAVRYRFVAERSGPRLRRLLGHRAAPHPRRTLAAAARGAPPDVVHLHGLSFPRQARALRRSLPRVLLVGQDHADRPATGWRAPVHRAGLRCLDAVVSTHEGLVRPFFAARMLRPDTAVVEAPEGSSTFRPGDRRAAARASGVQGDPAVLWVGAMVTDKDPRTALAAFGRLRCRGARLTMVVSAPGPERAAVERAVRGDGRLRGRVRVLGRLAHSAMEDALRAADVLLAPSRREGGAYTVVEALACGTPVVASDVPAHRALLGPAPPGALVPPGDVAGFARALERIHAAGPGGRDRARARFEAALSWDVVGRTLVDAYDALLLRRAPERSGVAAR